MSTPEGEISRRGLLKLGGAAIGGAFLGQEAGRLQEGRLVAGSGVFYPLYEKHSLGISPEKIPPEIDLFWREGFGANHSFQETDLDPQVLSVLVKKETKLVFGDVSARDLLPGETDIKVAAIVGGVTACCTLYAADRPEMTRRDYLKVLLPGLLAFEGWFLLPLLSGHGALQILEFNYKNNSPTAAAIERILERIGALSSHFHPEEAVIFFRNALWADKMLVLAEEEKKRLGRPPRVAYNVGAFHAGVEDFLFLGKDFCRRVITSYPSSWLKEVIGENGGVKAFASVRIVDLGRPPFDPEIITDNKLGELLEQKLA